MTLLEILDSELDNEPNILGQEPKKPFFALKTVRYDHVSSEWVREQLKQRNWKQEEFAERLGVSLSTAKKILKKDRKPYSPDRQMVLYWFFKAN